jgi:hypothetical protein
MKSTAPFVLRTQGEHADFAKELLAKTREYLRGQGSCLDLRVLNDGYVLSVTVERDLNNGLVLCDTVERGLFTYVTALDDSLRSYGSLPITPGESERAIEAGVLDDNRPSFENLALIYFDMSRKSDNYDWAKEVARQLIEKDSISKYLDMSRPVVVARYGIEFQDEKFVPVLIEGVTEAYNHDILDSGLTGTYRFSGYATDGGLPTIDQLSCGNKFDKRSSHRTIYLPYPNPGIGLYKLLHDGFGGLIVGRDYLANNFGNGVAHFAVKE